MIKLLLVFIVFIGRSANAEVHQSLGVDSAVDYKTLAHKGPWDDRNYQITQKDLNILPKNDQYLANVPLFYKIQARKESPGMGKYYPRVLYQTFLINYGGLLIDGIWYKQGLGRFYNQNQKYGINPVDYIETKAINDNEVVMDLGGAEMTIEMKPSNNMIGVAGVNGNGQSMYYTTNGGASWTKSQDNPGSSCCDPTIDWSSDSSRVYQADLGNCGSNACDVRAAYSDNDGLTWSSLVTVQDGKNSDKEFIHVDKSSASPYQDNVYLTYHTGNVMQFSRSIDMGVSWSTPLLFSSEATGIGSDITTDPSGNIYYFYPAFNGTVRMMKSTDGGLNFSTSSPISSLNGSFDMPIPAMETREAFIYVSTDVDVNTGNIYVAWTDEADDSAGGGAGSAANNHAWIQVAKSTDAGASWSMCTQPHDISDSLAGTPIDRFHPWLKVGENGVVHIGYYDTRNSVNRTGVDFFYTNSSDACSSWEPEIRATTVTSTNISNGFEWGDYNGLSVVLDKLAMGFTDNRPGQGVAAMVVSGVNPKSSSSFSLSTTNQDVMVCANENSVEANIVVDVLSTYNNPVTFSVNISPAFLSNVVFASNPISPTPGNSNFTFDVDASGTAGSHQLIIEGIGDKEGETGQISETLTYNILYSSAVTSAVALTMPANNSNNQPTSSTTFSWQADPNATSYRLLVSDDNGFANLLIDQILNNTSFLATNLPSSTQLYWKVASQSNCNASDVESVVFSFNTESKICFTTPTSIPDNNATGINLTLNIVDAGILDSLLFSVKSDHTWPGDLKFTLSHGLNTAVLMDRPGNPADGNGCKVDGVDVVFDDNSVVVVENVCENTSPGVRGIVLPDQLLSAFSGSELSGDWVLNASDNFGLDEGMLTEFCIVPSLVPMPTGLIFKNGFE